MSRPPSTADTARRARAKGAACETIGKLIGDDDAVRKGREDQAAAGRPGRTSKAKSKEQE